MESNIHYVDQLYSCIDKDDCFKNSFIDMEAAFQAQFFFEKSIFGRLFDIRPLADYNRPFGPINPCWEPSRIVDFDWSFTLS